MNPVDITLHGIVGPRSDGRDLAVLVRQAVEGGASVIQLRDKTGTTRAFIEEGRRLVAALAGTGVPLLINDRIDVALACGAAGVHVGQEDMLAVDARAILGPDRIIGLTINTAAEVAAARFDVIDYVCVGGIYPTRSKDNAGSPIGTAGLARLAALVREQAPAMPVGAIAGIDAGNATDVAKAGADGIAVMSALFETEDVAAAARKLVDATRAGVEARRGGGR